jgi:hypothetical protein
MKNKGSLIGIWELKHIRNGEIIHRETGKNIVTYQGMNKILDHIGGNTTLPQTWYVNLFKNNVTPSVSDTALSCLGNTGTYGECTDSDLDPQTNRQSVTFGSASNGTISSSNTVQFTAKQSFTVYGGFVVSTQAKLDTNGVLLSAKRFASPRVVQQNDILQITIVYTMTTS